MYVFLDQEGGCGRQKTPLSSLLKKKKTSITPYHPHPPTLPHPTISRKRQKDAENDPSSKSYSVRTTHGVGWGDGIKMKEKKMDGGAKKYLENRPKDSLLVCLILLFLDYHRISAYDL